MNRKKILGRASLSFPAVEGILDMDQILQTQPWSQIDGYVQNILNLFDDRVTRDPKFTPADNKSLGRKRATSSSGTTRKSQTGQTSDEEKLTRKKKNAQPADGGSKATERKKETANKRREEQGKKEAPMNRGRKTGIEQESKGEEKKSKAVARDSKSSSKCVDEKPKVEVNKARKPSTDSQKWKAGKSKGGKENKTVEPSKETENTVDSWPVRSEKSTMLISEKVANAEKNRSAMSVNASTDGNSKAPLKTSTPKRKTSNTSNFLGTKAAVANGSVSTRRKDSSIRSNASAKETCTRSTCAWRNGNNDYQEFAAKGDEGKKISAKCKCEATNTKTVKREETLENNETSRTLINGSTKSMREARDKTATSTERKQPGKFEIRLLERQERREKRNIRRHERKAERAMEQFSHHVTRIAKKMGYLPERMPCVICEGDDSYCDCSSDGSSCSDSSCSCSSCYTSCNSSYSNDSSSGYTEYTLASSSG